MFVPRPDLHSTARRALHVRSTPKLAPAPVLFGTRRHLATAQSANDFSITHLNKTFPYRWLRDSCQCTSCVHPTTLQKLHRTSDIPRDIAPKSDGVHTDQDQLRIEWPDGHISSYSNDFLSRYSSPSELAQFHRDAKREAWDVSTFDAAPNKVMSWMKMQNERGLLDAVDHLERYGLLIVNDLPNTDTTNEGAASRKLADTFSRLKTTFYGETWNVKNIINSRNIAYTNLYLGFHTDLQYFEAPPRFQILHCIRNRVKGGTSLFTDALAAAETLRRSDPAAFALLASVPVPFHYVNDGHHLHRTHTTIELARVPDARTGRFEIAHVNYSPPFQAPLPTDTPPMFFDALGRFAALLERDDAVYRYTLRETDAVVFDNRRVLHARTAFTDAEDVDGGEGVNRWLQGCYFDADSLMDRGRVLRKKAANGDI